MQESFPVTIKVVIRYVRFGFLPKGLFSICNADLRLDRALFENGWTAFRRSLLGRKQEQCHQATKMYRRQPKADLELSERSKFYEFDNPKESLSLRFLVETNETHLLQSMHDRRPEQRDRQTYSNCLWREQCCQSTMEFRKRHANLRCYLAVRDNGCSFSLEVFLCSFDELISLVFQYSSILLFKITTSAIGIPVARERERLVPVKWRSPSRVSFDVHCTSEMSNFFISLS